MVLGRMTQPSFLRPFQINFSCDASCLFSVVSCKLCSSVCARTYNHNTCETRAFIAHYPKQSHPFHSLLLYPYEYMLSTAIFFLVFTLQVEAPLCKLELMESGQWTQRNVAAGILSTFIFHSGNHRDRLLKYGYS